MSHTNMIGANRSECGVAWAPALGSELCVKSPMLNMEEDVRMSYQRYIASAAWRNNPARIEELEASGRRCRICNIGEDAELQVHHRTYVRLYAELPGDLTTLCADCHRGVTSMLRDRRYACRTPKRTDIARPLINSRPLIESTYGAINDQK